MQKMYKPCKATGVPEIVSGLQRAGRMRSKISSVRRADFGNPERRRGVISTLRMCRDKDGRSRRVSEGIWFGS